MKLRILSYGTPPSHRRPVIAHECSAELSRTERGGGHNWSGVDPPLSLQPRLPYGLPCVISSQCGLVASGLLHCPRVPVPPWLGSGLRVQGFIAWVTPPLESGVRVVAGGGGGQSVRCGPATVAPAAPAPRPSSLSQFITCSFGHWPCLCSIQFQVPASLAGVRAVGLGFWALPPGHTTHMILSPGRGVYVVFHV